MGIISESHLLTRKISYLLEKMALYPVDSFGMTFFNSNDKSPFFFDLSAFYAYQIAKFYNCCTDTCD